jgi:DNA mismatch repair ATPase MutS
LTIPDGLKLTPWLAQYKKWKAEYPGALLLFRMGDFYELLPFRAALSTTRTARI